MQKPIISKPDISVISPIYLAEKIVPELVKRIKDEVALITKNFEIVLVEDGSPDKSWEAVLEQCENYSFVKGIKLSRNFGQHYAITAGISEASGNLVVIMDCDLQDNPSYISTLYKKLNEGYDTVFTIRKNRKHNSFKQVTAWIYNSIFSLLADKDYRLNMGSLVMFREKVGKEFLRLNDHDRLYIQLLKWVGFNQTAIEVEHDPRLEGKSTYSVYKLLKIAFQGLTSHSDKLLRLSIYSGFILAFFSFVALIIITILYFSYGMQAGWPSVICTILLSSGLILISIGIAGIYIGKNFEQSKNRPLFIIKERINIPPANTSIN